MKILVIFLLGVATLFIQFCTAKTINNERSNQIAKSTECAYDYKKLCGNEKHDLSILRCFQDSEEVMNRISEECQNYLWEFKHNLTTSDLFDSIIKDQCSKELQSITVCNGASAGHRVPCLVDHKEHIESKQCSQFLDEIATIVFSDYHMIYKFVDHCSGDIKKFKCGRIVKNGSKSRNDQEIDENVEHPLKNAGLNLAEAVSSQMNTLDCLIDSIHDLEPGCKHQITRLSELQSNDYHLNRALYYACRDDRETLCHDVVSGEGRVYDCLFREKFSKKMSEECRKELTRKQQVESVDVRANYPLIHSCQKDIKEHQCLKDVSDSSHEIVAMSEVLICLHYAELSGHRLQSLCQVEISERRKQMLDDLQISPETLLACQNEVDEHCIAKISEPGGVVHCLLNLAEPDKHNKNGRLSKSCQDAMLSLLKVSNPTEDVMIADSAIREACSSSYMALCHQNTNGKDAFNCLVDNINNPSLTSKCRDKLSSLLYFISLDIRIDDNLHKACRHDAMLHCDAPRTQEQMNKQTNLDSNMEYHCMYRKYKEDRIMMDLAEARGLPVTAANFSLSAECFQEIFNVMKLQASKIEFDPKIYVPCFDDIGRYCGQDDSRGHEIECLQSNVKKLEDKCRESIIEFSEMEDIDNRLNSMLYVACNPMIDLFCHQNKRKDILVCLKEHKYHPQMSGSCRTAIEHMQIISLEEYHIDHRFASFCNAEIEEYCQDGLTRIKNGEHKKTATKSAIVTCLSKTVTSKLLNGDKNPLSEECRRQFTFELLQRSETIKLDPKLIDDCADDMEKFCKNLKSNRISSCLRENQDRLSDKCHLRMFRRERLEALDANFDGELQHVCSEMIHKNCHEVPGSRMFGCLQSLINTPLFDQDCRRLILVRLERRMNDIRLNPELINDCSFDIKKYCHLPKPNIDEPANGIEYNGQIIRCLKNEVINNSVTLQDDCRKRVVLIMIESNTNSRLDPILRKECDKEINTFCQKELSSEYADPVNSVQNCLKHKYLKGKIYTPSCQTEIIRLLKESRADVHVDYELFEACENTIMKLCRSDSFGFGRKLSCLLSLVENSKASVLIDEHCLQIVKERKEMWTMAGGMGKVQSLSELYSHVTSSSTKVYLLSMLGLIVAGLVLLGICCGRVSKRVLVDQKNK